MSGAMVVINIVSSHQKVTAECEFCNLALKPELSMLRMRLELIFSTAAYRPWNSTKHQEPKSVFVEHPNKTSSHDSSQSSASAFEQGYNGPPLLYHRGLKATRWMSWSDTNPGRRYYGCSNYKESDCRFFVWHGREMSRRAKDVIIQFRDTGRALKREFGTEK